MATLTDANSVLVIDLPDLFAVPTQIQGYATDDAFATESIKPTETRMGVDGVLSGGFVPTVKTLNVTLQADSASIGFFDAWFNGQEAAQEAFICNASLTIPGLSKNYAMTRGFLSGYVPTPDGKKILEPQRFQIEFNFIVPANI